MTRAPRPRRLEEESRLARNGQAVAIAGFFASLIVGALLFLMFKPVINPILVEADERATNETVQQGNVWLGDILANIPFVFVGIGVVGLIALAVFRSRFA